MAVLRTPQKRQRDLLNLPVVGRFLRWKHARTSMQAVLLAVSALILYDGFWGPQLAPKNLAGVLPWVHWRGFVVLALLIAGNLFCMACPFMLPRRLAKKLLPANRPWPKFIRSKWLAIGVLLVFFWAYEAFDLWASPWLTAWVVLTYFVAAFAIDGIFQGAAFCKYVCPIGQFHFVHSMVSPLEVKVRQPAICGTCTTKDCIKGRFSPKKPRHLMPVIPAKAGIHTTWTSPSKRRNDACSVIPAKAGIHLPEKQNKRDVCSAIPATSRNPDFKHYACSVKTHAVSRKKRFPPQPDFNSCKPAASCGYSKNARSATWTARSVWTASKRAPTTTSASSYARPPVSFAACRSGAPVWARW